MSEDFCSRAEAFHILLISLLGLHVFTALHMIHGPIRYGHSTAKVQGELLSALLRLSKPS